ncbi:MAG: class I SAM-dependent methyltransferase [Patescibacteria group bacterium]|nr:class I SAM-dependent methyltransferase [Patescibacteria group bacterium]MDD4611075.1 class I SAM-dependent methyltransferase [Patescibacteria group bacterium]
MSHSDKIFQNKQELIDTLVGPDDVVLDVGFWGQGLTIDKKNWVHSLLLKRARKVYGIDLYFDLNKLANKENYSRQNAENFGFSFGFDVIFAGDLIEHLSNPGLFLDSCRKNLKDNGKLIITTPNCFGLFNLAEKISKYEPTVNSDHTCYFNLKTIKQLLKKNNFEVSEYYYLYSLGLDYKESWKKKILNLFYYFFSKFTSKFIDTLVIVARKKDL